MLLAPALAKPEAGPRPGEPGSPVLEASDRRELSRLRGDPWGCEEWGRIERSVPGGLASRLGDLARSGIIGLNVSGVGTPFP